jgi:hypothetical protein
MYIKISSLYICANCSYSCNTVLCRTKSRRQLILGLRVSELRAVTGAAGAGAVTGAGAGAVTGAGAGTGVGAGTRAGTVAAEKTSIGSIESIIDISCIAEFGAAVQTHHSVSHTWK